MIALLIMIPVVIALLLGIITPTTVLVVLCLVIFALCAVTLHTLGLLSTAANRFVYSHRV